MSMQFGSYCHSVGHPGRDSGQRLVQMFKPGEAVAAPGEALKCRKLPEQCF